MHEHIPNTYEVRISAPRIIAMQTKNEIHINPIQ